MEKCLCLLHCCCCFPCVVTEEIRNATFPSPNRSLRLLERQFYSARETEEDKEKVTVFWLSIKGTADGKAEKGTDCVPAFYIKATPNQKSNFTVIYSHGNAEDIAYEQIFVKALAEKTGIDFLLYEYPGYSLSKFTPEKAGKSVKTSETKVNLAAEAAWKYLVNEAKIPPQEIILFGRSIGSGPTVHLASRKQMVHVHEKLTPQFAAGVFLISPILSTIRAVCGPKLACCFPCYDKFHNHSKIHQVEAPVAIMHAKDDEVVQYYNGVQLFQKLKEEQRFAAKWLEEGGHNEILPVDILKYFQNFVAHLKENKEGFKPEKVPTSEDFKYKVDPPTLTDFSTNDVIEATADLYKKSF